MNIDVTTSQFWTCWTYDNKDFTLYDKDGNKKGHYGRHYDKNSDNDQYAKKTNVSKEDHANRYISGVGVYNWTIEDNTGRSGWGDAELCVTLGHHYEFRTQLLCDSSKSSACHWNFINYYASNCNNLQGVICTHKNVRDSKLNWFTFLLQNK